MPDVAMIVSNPCNPDPRVEKEALSLQNSGFNVIIHAFDRQENSDSLSKIEVSSHLLLHLNFII